MISIICVLYWGMILEIKPRDLVCWAKCSAFEPQLHCDAINFIKASNLSFKTWIQILALLCTVWPRQVR